MTSQILIEELTPSESNLIQESTQDGKTLWLTGIYMMAASPNRNGRIYPITEIQQAVNVANQKIQESRGIMGELDHPPSLTINLDRVSHVITEMKMVGTNAIGKSKILNTPTGNIAKALIESGVAIGVSSRGAGQVNEATGEVSGFAYITNDLVATPSAQSAIPNPVYESLEMASNGKQIMNLSEAVIHDEAAQEYFKREIQKWINTNVFKRK